MSSMVRRRLFCPAAARSVRSARAVRPWRPITLPRSLGATSSSMMSWSPRSYERVWTASASSTSDLATNSMRSFMSCELRVASCESRNQQLLLRLLPQGFHGRRQLRPLRNPVVHPRAIDLDVGRVLFRIVMADLLDRRRARGLQHEFTNSFEMGRQSYRNALPNINQTLRIP